MDFPEIFTTHYWYLLTHLYFTCLVLCRIQFQKVIGQRSGLSTIDARQANLLYKNCGKEYTNLYHQENGDFMNSFSPCHQNRTQSIDDSNCGFVRKIIKMKTFKLQFPPGAVGYVVQVNCLFCVCGYHIVLRFMIKLNEASKWYFLRVLIVVSNAR